MKKLVTPTHQSSEKASSGLRFDGIYVCPSSCGHDYVMRFFPNGVVCRWREDRPPRNVWKKLQWPTRLYPLYRTSYQMEDDLARFTLSDMRGKVSYLTAFNDSGAAQSCFNHANAYKGHLRFKFYKTRDLVLELPVAPSESDIQAIIKERIEKYNREFPYKQLPTPAPFISGEPDAPNQFNDDNNQFDATRLIDYLGNKSSVNLCVYWPDDSHEVVIGRPTWLRICSGDFYTKRGKPYRYEAASYKTKWHFNTDHPGSLIVTYESSRCDGDDGDGFVGDIVDAFVD